MENSVQDLAAINCSECHQHKPGTRGICLVCGCGDEFLMPGCCEDCYYCHGTGREFWQLLQTCGCETREYDRHECWHCYRYGKHELGKCNRCQGSGWVLKPEAEQEVALINLCSLVEFRTYPSYDYGKGFMVRAYPFKSDRVGIGYAEKRLDALAQSIGQALEG